MDTSEEKCGGTGHDADCYCSGCPDCGPKESHIVEYAIY